MIDVSEAIDGEFVVEAPTVEAAVADVERRTGRAPEVLEVERVVRGGIGGFFAREVVRVRVRVQPPGAGSGQAPTQPPSDRASSILEVAGERIAEARPRGVDGVLQALTNVNDERERDFEAQLRVALQRGVPVRPADLDREASAREPQAPPRAPAPPATGAATHRQAQRPLARALFDEHPEPPVDVKPWVPTRIEPAGPATQAPVRSSTADHVDVPPVRELAAAPTPDVAPVGRAPDPVEDAAEPAAPSGTGTTPEPTPSPGPEDRGSLIPASILARIQGEHTGDDEEVVDGVLVEAGDQAEASKATHASAAMASPAAEQPEAPVIRAPRRLATGSPLATGRVLPGGVAWSRDALYRVGLPGTLLDRLEVPAGSDELAWLQAVGETVLPWCRPLPAGSSVLVGPRAGTLGRLLDLATAEKGGRPPYGGDVALVATDSPGARSWVQEVMGDRWLHLVMGGRRWEGLVTAAPRAVSVVGRELVVEALGLCVSFDLVLGHLADDTRSERAVRLRPLDVALAVRDLLPRVEGA